MTPAVPSAALIPPGPVEATRPVTAPAPGRAARTEAASGPSFADLLARQTQAAQAPRFSRHAVDRIHQRGIQLTQPTLDRLTGGVTSAAGKGSRNAVVFVDGTAFVVSVSNNTVVTAVDSGHMREHVFTNIDSAVVA